MINKKRVRRIKNVIYAFIIIAFFLPAVLVVALFFKMLHLENTINQAMGQQAMAIPVRQVLASIDAAAGSEGQSEIEEHDDVALSVDASSAVQPESTGIQGGSPEVHGEPNLGQPIESSNSPVEQPAQPIYMGDAALAFDAPNTGRVQELYLLVRDPSLQSQLHFAELLEQREESATFFLQWVEPELCKRLAATGSTLGIYLDLHRFATAAEAMEAFEHTEAAILAATDQTPWLYGVESGSGDTLTEDALARTLEQRGYTRINLAVDAAIAPVYTEDFFFRLSQRMLFAGSDNYVFAPINKKQVAFIL